MDTDDRSIAFAGATHRRSRSRGPALATLGAAVLLWIVGCGMPAPGLGTSGDATRGTPAADDHAALESGSVAAGHEHRAMATGHEHGAMVGGDHADPEDHGAHATGLSSAAPSEHSVYLLPSSWTDQSSAPVELKDLAGRAQVVAMVYTSCSFACPRLLAQMKRMEGVLAEEGLLDRVGFTLVSIDPERDTPERLANFAEGSRLDAERWTLLNGGDEDVRALSILLGIQYREADEGQFEHSNVLTILDPQGVPVYRLEGLNADPGPALEALRRVVE